MCTVPFREDEELYLGLKLNQYDKSAPELRRTDSATLSTLPGNAFVELDFESISTHLQATVLTTKLNTFAPHLWLVSTQSSSSISPLHKQIILGREIIITDYADLHLVWYHSKIFIKPLPRYLLSHAFWSFIFDSRNSEYVAKQLHPAIIGLVRSYCHLIKSETDFRLAVSQGLIPPDVEVQNFSRFLRRFEMIPDAQVSPRFHFGELRLSRLNLFSLLFLRQTHYFNLSRQYETYFSRFFQPLLFAFGTISVLLSAMQVALAAEAIPVLGDRWDDFVAVSKWTSIAAIFIALLPAVWLLALFIGKVLRELAFAVKSMLRRRFIDPKEAV